MTLLDFSDESQNGELPLNTRISKPGGMNLHLLQFV